MALSLILQYNYPPAWNYKNLYTLLSFHCFALTLHPLLKWALSGCLVCLIFALALLKNCVSDKWLLKIPHQRNIVWLLWRHVWRNRTILSGLSYVWENWTCWGCQKNHVQSGYWGVAVWWCIPSPRFIMYHRGFCGHKRARTCYWKMVRFCMGKLLGLICWIPLL